MTTFKSCLICNTYKNDCMSVFDSKVILKSGNKLTAVVNKILDEQVTRQRDDTSEICKSCYKHCIEYDQLHSRLKEIKADLKHKHKSTVLKVDCQNLAADSPKSAPKKLVLPASKLKPLPDNYIINVKSALMNNKSTSATNIKTNPKEDIKPGTSLLSTNVKSPIKPSNVISPKLKTTPSYSPKRLPRLAPKVQSTVPNKPTTTSILTSASSLLTAPSSLLTTPNSILTSDGNLLITSNSILTSAGSLLSTPSSILTNGGSLLTSTVQTDSLSQEVIRITDNLDSRNVNVILHEINEEHPMEIDEECTYVNLKTEDISEATEQQDDDDDDEDDGSDQELIKITLPSIDGDSNNDDQIQESEDFVIGKVEIMEGDHELGDDHAILMEENGSIIRLVSGQKFIYNDKEISLIIPEQDSDNNQEEEGSQIELDHSQNSKMLKAMKKVTDKNTYTYIKTETDEMRGVESISTQNEAHNIVQPDGECFKCVLCERSKNRVSFSSDALSVMRHVRDEHNARVYICSTCGEIMRKRSDFTDHTTMHADESSASRGLERNAYYECHYCSKKFVSRNLLIDHVNVHNGTKPHQCDKCNKKFSSRYTFQAHQKTHMDRPRPYSCQTCGKAFYTSQNLTQHVKIHQHREEFECNVCHKMFGSQHNLEVHGIVHSGKKPFLCGICNKQFARRAEIRDHLRTHTGERPFKCDLCGTSFSQRSNLQSHKRATHYNDQRYVCTECPKKFKRRRLLDYHIKATHTGERPHKCSICGATFVYPEHYKKHLRSHSGQKPYSCAVCHKTFSTRDNRNVHMFTHSDRKPYECVVCGANFMRKPQLFSHMRSFGHLSEQIMINQPRLTPDNNEVITDHRLLAVDGDDTEQADEMTEDSDTAKVLITNKGIILRDETGNAQMYTVDFDASNNAEQLFTAEIQDANVKSDANDTTDLSGNPEIVAKDSSGGVVFRLVQMELEGGGTGWVTVEE